MSCVCCLTQSIPPTTLRPTPVADPSDLRASRPALAAGLPDDALQEINRLWTIVRVFSNTAHDVNNALQVIAGSAELLEARDLDSAVRRRVETIRVEAAKAAITINRLLTYARSGALPIVALENAGCEGGRNVRRFRNLVPNRWDVAKEDQHGVEVPHVPLKMSTEVAPP